MAIERKSGAFKVLDLERERVYTLMSDPADARKLRERIGYSRSVERYSLRAPALHDVEPERGYFAETYLPRDAAPWLPGLLRGVREQRCLGLLVDIEERAETPQRSPLAEYVGALRHAILAPDGLARRLPAEAFDRIRLRVRGQRHDRRGGRADRSR
ncbi:MAG: hypothetical protein U5J97_12375 [Trueperaceae bacterium]|nr:hypothetical protein [Trueperaceae bacterium]